MAKRSRQPSGGCYDPKRSKNKKTSLSLVRGSTKPGGEHTQTACYAFALKSFLAFSIENTGSTTLPPFRPPRLFIPAVCSSLKQLWGRAHPQTRTVHTNKQH